MLKTPVIANKLKKAVEKNGYFLAPAVLGVVAIENLLKSFEAYSDSRHAVVRAGKTYALRSVLNEIREVKEVAVCDAVMELVKAVLGEDARPTKAILFDKTEGVNWNLGWHQDLTISVEKRIEIEGFGPWSQKAGVPHVQPPVEVMESILAARMHLDDCGEENGALHVIPGSHAHGILSLEDLKQGWKQEDREICSANRGDILFMRPLLLHSSKKAEKPSHRRVLHIEYSARKLPGGLEWGG